MKRYKRWRLERRKRNLRRKLVFLTEVTFKYRDAFDHPQVKAWRAEHADTLRELNQLEALT